jgi:hypothetical protein
MGPMRASERRTIGVRRKRSQAALNEVRRDDIRVSERSHARKRERTNGMLMQTGARMMRGVIGVARLSMCISLFGKRRNHRALPRAQDELQGALRGRQHVPERNKRPRREQRQEPDEPAMSASGRHKAARSISGRASLDMDRGSGK